MKKPWPNWTRFRLRTMLLAVPVFAVVIALGVSLADRLGPDVRSGEWVGWTQEAIVSRLGSPTETFEKDLNVANEPRLIVPLPGPYRTLHYGGDADLYLKLRRDRGRWVCYWSLWIRKGVLVCS
ncbi:MAG: hypothetical protein ABI353_19585 [Isosphaeraceae bacterium]